ncbi:MAG: methionine--tRNA ligase subunit beta [Nitrosopumilus sp.]|nr:methionine--tRNA ligase subunit beta [Nitrosopumilus sp.]
MDNEKNTISFIDFEKISLQVGKIINAERLNGYNKILKILVDLGDERREIMSGIAKNYSPEELVDKLVIVCTNLEPKKFGENTSNGMILAAEKDKKPILLTVYEEVEPGSQVL